MKKSISLSVALLSLLYPALMAQSVEPDDSPDANLRLLYWNIQNGMWDGQPDNYDRFVNFVNENNPDVCVWCEAATIYDDNTDKGRDASKCYLPNNWGELAARYGHKFWFIGGYRDSYPQVITSRYPIRGISRITGSKPDSIVSHGAGWAQIEKNGKTINIVSLHTWPQRYSFLVSDSLHLRPASAANCEGDKYRRMEIEYICNNTIGKSKAPEEELWMMMGDFNSKSRVDDFHYKYPADTTAYLVHDFIRNNTPYVDVIAEQYPQEFKSSIFGDGRIDFVYCSPALYKTVTDAAIIRNAYTEPVRDPQKLSNFCIPSDHCPIIVNFNLSK
ncbi:MAG: endonuclease [Firmicutes bacterium]|nr:endonuclease [Bacillota bacterium]MCM1401155.1 endonuclease [Bacteroides sp.]MCM1477022.1 endonuclease [Bacteroides sp.]